MAKIEYRLSAPGLVLPPAFTPPPGVVLPFVNVRLIGNRAVIAGHGPQSQEGPLAQPLGKVGRDLTLEQGYIAAARRDERPSADAFLAAMPFPQRRVDRPLTR